MLRLKNEFLALDKEQNGYLKYGQLPILVEDAREAKKVCVDIDTNKDGKISYDGMIVVYK